MNSIVTLTDAAVTHIQNMISKQEGSNAFRISIKKTGCSGYAYVPNIVAAGEANDIEITTSQGLQVYVDPKCVDFISGTIIDYVIDNAGLKQKRLMFINPNEKNRCGCGESFTIE